MADTVACGACFRSLGQTLVAAASTCALFCAVNWSYPPFLGHVALTENLFGRMIELTLIFLGMPICAFIASLLNASEVWSVKSKLLLSAGTSTTPTSSHGSIAIITLCPIFIRIPRGFAPSHEELLGPNLHPFYKTITDSQLESLCPLELRPSYTAPHISANTSNHADAADVQSDSSSSSTQWVCFRLPHTDYENLTERLALLRLGLVPTYQELGHLRSRSTFQSVVTAFQAIGYLLSIVQRIVQHLEISPIEAIVTFLCIIISFQLLVELYACGDFRRPLLLDLDSDQFMRFRNANRKDFQYLDTTSALVASLSVMLLLTSIPALYYFSHYVHTQFICALSALLFFLTQALFVILYMLVLAKYLEINMMIGGLTLGSALLCFSSMIVACIGTVVHWEVFRNPSPHNWFAWILPHASS